LGQFAQKYEVIGQLYRFTLPSMASSLAWSNDTWGELSRESFDERC